jgi:hypothetical protein
MSSPASTPEVPAVALVRVRPPRRLRVALIAGPSAWGVQLLGGWLVEGAACHDRHPALALNAAGVRLLEIVLLVAALAVALAALRIGWTAWQQARVEPVSRLLASERPEFVAVATTFVSAACVLAVVWAGLAPIVLPMCESVR